MAGNKFTQQQIAEDTEREMRGRPQKHGAAMKDEEGLAPTHAPAHGGGHGKPHHAGGARRPAPPHKPMPHAGGMPHGSGATADTQVSNENLMPEDLGAVNEPEPPSLESHHSAIADHDSRLAAIEAKLGMNKQTASPEESDDLGFGETAG